MNDDQLDSIVQAEDSEFAPAEVPDVALPSSDDFVGDPFPDPRLYIPDNHDWEIGIKRNSERYFCHSKNPGQDWFHLILGGEVFVSRQHERYCLRCALRLGFLTRDRLFWQHRVPKRPKNNP
jgi:hypothetical protein